MWQRIRRIIWSAIQVEKDYKKCDTGKVILKSFMVKEQDELESEMEAFSGYWYFFKYHNTSIAACQQLLSNQDCHLP